MLKRLRIKNFALIENLDLIFSSGFNVITGETGAGKSIILGALNLIFGDRASTEMFREGTEELQVEGCFEIPGYDDDLIIRREMFQGGKSFIFINDKQTTLQTLKDTMSSVAEIMGQHQHQNLLNPANHVLILDRFGNLENDALEFRDLLRELETLKSELQKLINSRQERLQRADYLKFQLAEIEAAELKPDEETSLTEERRILKNSAFLKESSSAMFSILYDDETSVYERVNACQEYFRKIKAIDNNFPVKAEDVENLAILAEEIGKASAAYGDNIEDDPSRLEWIEERLLVIDRLKNKYGPDIQSILKYADEIRNEIDISDNFDKKIDDLRNELQRKSDILIKSGLVLEKKRKEASEKLASKLKKPLAAMGMARMEFVTEFSAPDGGHKIEFDNSEYMVTDTGLSHLEFFISPNPGEGIKPLRKIASGGEISRVMLAIKTALAEKDNIGLLVFDEVDTGIGGEVAVKVGSLLKELSGSHQIICITHLQQIASVADKHFAVWKKTIRKRTLTFVKGLEGEERVSEIARLIAGDSHSRTSVQIARDLLSKPREK